MLPAVLESVPICGLGVRTHLIQPTMLSGTVETNSISLFRSNPVFLVTGKETDVIILHTEPGPH